MQTIYILCGIIGSGKSTWARNKAQEENVIILNRDSIREMIKGKYIYNKIYEYFIRRLVHNSLQFALEEGFDVVVDETNITIRKRKDWFDLISYFKEKFGKVFNVKVIYFTEKERNLENRMTDPKGLPREEWEDVYKSMLENFEEPTIDELEEFNDIGNCEIIKVKI